MLRATRLPHSKEIPFDNSTNGFTATDAQAAIEELNTTVGVSASPGFTWGRSGNLPTSTYLLNDTVPCNLSGRVVHLTTGNVVGAFVAVEDDATCTFDILKRTGPATFVSLQTCSLVAERKKAFAFDPGAAVVSGDELVVQISVGSCKNCDFGILIRGSTA